MDTTARELADWARQSIIALSHDPAYRSRNAVYLRLHKDTGLSLPYLQKFTQGVKDNPTMETIDALVKSIKSAKQAAI